MASKREVIWAASAIKELDNILDYLEKTVSENFFNTLKHSIELIKSFSFSCTFKRKEFF